MKKWATILLSYSFHLMRHTISYRQMSLHTLKALRSRSSGEGCSGCYPRGYWAHAPQMAGEAVDVAAALVEYGPGERSVGSACCLALCQAGAAPPLLKMATSDPGRPSSITACTCSAALKLFFALHVQLPERRRIVLHMHMSCLVPQRSDIPTIGMSQLPERRWQMIWMTCHDPFTIRYPPWNTLEDPAERVPSLKLSCAMSGYGDSAEDGVGRASPAGAAERGALPGVLHPPGQQCAAGLQDRLPGSHTAARSC